MALTAPLIDVAPIAASVVRHHSSSQLRLLQSNARSPDRLATDGWTGNAINAGVDLRFKNDLRWQLSWRCGGKLKQLVRRSNWPLDEAVYAVLSWSGLISTDRLPFACVANHG